jgi:hypothetical protein
MTRAVDSDRARSHRLRVAAFAYMEAFPVTAAWLPLDAEPEDAGELVTLYEAALRDGRLLTQAQTDRCTAYGRLSAAMDRYRDAFGTTPDTWRMNPARGPALIAAMDAALHAGRALTVDEASAVTGCKPPPLGTVG